MLCLVFYAVLYVNIVDCKRGNLQIESMKKNSIRHKNKTTYQYLNEFFTLDLIAKCLNMCHIVTEVCSLRIKKENVTLYENIIRKALYCDRVFLYIIFERFEFIKD